MDESVISNDYTYYTVGGLTRLTDSGLSITTWELIVGVLPPLTNEKWIEYFNLYKDIPEYKEQNFNMSLNDFKIIFWWEWAHRQLGRLIGLLTFIPMIYFTIKHGFLDLKKYGIIFYWFVYRFNWLVHGFKWFSR